MEYEKRRELEKRTFRHVLIALGIIFALIIIGSIIKYQETDTYKEALYKTVSTVTHLDVEGDSQGFISFILYVAGGIVSLFIALTLLRLITEGSLKKDIEEDHNMKKVKTFTNHIIICGAGRVGSNVAAVLEAQKQEFILIDNNPDTVLRATKKGWMAIEDDALDPNGLELAGIQKARALISCLNSDGDNVLLCLTAKELNPRISIVARADYERNVEKLKKAGATEIVLPTHIAGQMIAKTLLAPSASSAPIPPAKPKTA